MIQMEARRRAVLQQAWLTASLIRADVLPELDKLLEERPERQTAEELQIMIDALAVAWGAKPEVRA